jgi:hypothetical protein
VVPRPAGATRNRRRALLLLAAVVALTNLAALVVVLGWPAPDDGDRYTYAVVEPMRDYMRAWLVFAAVNLVVGVTTLALAGWLLVPTRGFVPATLGAVLMWSGCALYAVGVGAVAGAYYFATEPAVLDAAVSARLLDHMHDSLLSVWGAVLAGGGVMVVGQVLLGVGLWRARTVPRWVPVLLWTLPLTFVLPSSGLPGLLVGVPVAAGGLAVAWYLWRGVAVPPEGDASPAGGVAQAAP